jgi:circadian clock protein KaiB
MSNTAKRDHPEAKPSLQFCLYVVGQNSSSIRALLNLKKLSEEQCAGKYKIEVIDVVAQPHLARTQNIVAVPTLVRTFPMPMR